MTSSPLLNQAIITGVRDCALIAAVAVQSEFKSSQYRISSKGEAGPLTSADLLANEICHALLPEILPEAGWLSEESDDSSERLKSDYTWIIDPIDGTREFINGVGEFAVSIGLAYRGRAILGAVALPAEKRLIIGGFEVGIQNLSYQLLESPPVSGSMGEELTLSFPSTVKIDKLISSPDSAEVIGRELNFLIQDNSLDYKPVTNLKNSRIVVSRSEWNNGVFTDLAADFVFRQGGSIARKLALVAVGDCDLTISLYPKNEWDICAGAALVQAGSINKMVELDNMELHSFNQPETRSLGLAAGRKELVDEFIDYFRSKKIEVRSFYS